jgi:hypothetical protein
MAKKTKSRSRSRAKSTPAPRAAPVRAVRDSRPASVTILAFVHLGFGALFLLFGLFALAMGVGMAGVPLIGGLFGGIAAFAGMLVLILGVLDIAAGWGLWHMRNYGRILASIGAAAGLLAFPLGTAFGLIVLYWLWVRHANEFN